jgi:hypothetical protein
MAIDIEPLCKILSFPTIMVHVIAIATFDLAETRDKRRLKIIDVF